MFFLCENKTIIIIICEGIFFCNGPIAMAINYGKGKNDLDYDLREIALMAWFQKDWRKEKCL